MSDYKTVSITVSGRISGHIWMPATLSWKPFSFTVDRSLGDHYFANGPVPDIKTGFDVVTMDGDFQNATIDYALLKVKRVKPGGYTHTRVVELDAGDYATPQEQVEEVELAGLQEE